MNKMLKAAAYARTSTILKQDPELQHVAIREYASKSNISIVKVFTDQITGSSARRPALDQMMAAVKRHEFDLIIISALDRLGRSSAHLIGLIPTLREHKVSLTSLRESLSLETPSGRAFFGIMSVLAELDKEVISERIRSALQSKKILAQQSGSDWRCGRPKRINDQLIAEVHRLRTEGISIRQIEKRLDKAISRSSIERILGMKR